MSTVRRGHDAKVDSAKPNANYGDANTVKLQGASQYAFVYMPVPDDLLGKTVASATLTGHAASSTAAQNVTARQVTTGWTAGKVTWNTKPTTVSTGATTTAVGVLSAGDEMALDVTDIVQSWANGTTNYGVRLSTDAATAQSFYAFDSGQDSWTLTIETSDAPQAPSALVPNGGWVGESKPTLMFDFTDNGGDSTDLAAIQVQIDPAHNGTSPAFDTGTLAASEPMLDLSTTAYAGLAGGSTTYWRVRVQDGSGLWSAWSDWASFSYRARLSITVDSPAAGILWDPTSDILVHVSGATNLTAYRVRITNGTDRTKVRFDTGKTAASGTDIAVALPQKWHGSRVLIDDRNYQLHVRVWDDLDRQATPGCPVWTDDWSTFHFDDDAGVPPIATIVARQVRDTPAVKVTWTRAAAPDAWVVLRDGYVLARLDPADVVSGVSTYEWKDPHPRPSVEHIYAVKAISGGHQSKVGPRAKVTTGVTGIWLYGVDDDTRHVRMEGIGVDQLRITDRRSTFSPINLRYDVDVVQALKGISGTISATLTEGVTSQVVSDAIDTLMDWKESSSVPVRLIYGDVSVPVTLANVSVLPSAIWNPNNNQHAVTFDVQQVGDFDPDDLMYQLALNRADLAAYRRMLVTPGQKRRIRIEVLTLNLQHLRSMTTDHVDGQVVMDVTTKPTRMLTLKVVDKNRVLAFKPASPGGPPLYRDKVIRVWYCTYVDALSDWVECPVFTGPIWDFDRTGADVNLVAHGMERQALGQVWHPFHRDPGYPKVIAMRDLMVQAAGDALPAFPPLLDRLPVGITVGPMESAWPHVRQIAESMNRHVFYDGRGTAQLRLHGSKPVFVFNDELTSEPTFARSKGQPINTVEVVGAKPKGSKQRVRAFAVAGHHHPLSPWSLGRASSELRLVERVENDHLRTKADCQAVADRKLERHLHEQTTVSLSTVPIPFLEESDMVAVETPDLGRVKFRLRQFTLPLGMDGTPMSIGSVRNAADVGRSRG